MLEESDSESVESFQDETDYSLEIVEGEQGVELVSRNRLINF